MRYLICLSILLSGCGVTSYQRSMDQMMEDVKHLNSEQMTKEIEKAQKYEMPKQT